MIRYLSFCLLFGLSFSLLAQTEPVPSRPDWAPFLHGVASGDPLTDRVIIWTRLTTEAGDPTTVDVSWKMATDVQLQNVVQSGMTTTDASVDYTVKVDVTGLQAGTTYYYGFEALDKRSLTGRTQTSPTGNNVEHLRFGVVSCTSFQDGFFSAYGDLASRNDLDAIVHLGDYIYEGYRADTDRPMLPTNRLTTLEDYRLRYWTYRLDTNLIRAHQQHPFLTVWDDHEFSDNVYRDGAASHNPESDGPWEVRKAAAKQAYFEWMPIRVAEINPVIYRTIRYGNLAEIILLDTRVEGREEQVYDPFDDRIQDPNRTILGATQKSWLLDQLSNSTASWKVIAQQVPLAPLELGWSAAIDQDPSTRYDEIQGATLDAWNGYPAERSSVLDFISVENISNVVILTGSYHVSLAFEVSADPVLISYTGEAGNVTPRYTTNPNYDPATGAGAVAIEFATPSITSNNFDENFGAAIAVVSESLINTNIPTVGNPNPHLKYADLINHGFFILDVKPDSVQANWYHTGKAPNSSTAYEQGYHSASGTNQLRAAAQESAAKVNAPDPAPVDPPTGQTSTNTNQLPAELAHFKIVPNPASNVAILTLDLTERAVIRAQLIDANGRTLRTFFNIDHATGSYQHAYPLGGIPAGFYTVRLEVNGKVVQRKLVVE